VKPLRIIPGRAVPPEAIGAVLARDLEIDEERWLKGRRLTPADAGRLVGAGAAGGGRQDRDDGASQAITLLVLDADDVHEDDAALRLARAVAGPGVELRGPASSRVDLVATADGVLRVRAAAVERLDRIDPLLVFSLYDGQTVQAGELVASVKVGPHAVPGAVLERGLALARHGAPLVRVLPFVRRRVAAVVKETLKPAARARFERGIALRVESLGSTFTGVRYVRDDADEEFAVLRSLVRGPGKVDLVLTAGAALTDPTDALFVAIGRLGGRVVRRGVPAHPGSMAWLARVGATDLLGLPSCGAYSRATAADLLLPRLLTGERASSSLAASLGHGGMLVAAMRFRFPPYARQLEAPSAGGGRDRAP
jgi:molybdenum cofactor cytidylyltransferase